MALCASGLPACRIYPARRLLTRQGCGRAQLCSIVVPGMKARKRGAIVNVGSGSATYLPSYPLYAVYGASKARTTFHLPVCAAFFSQQSWHEDGVLHQQCHLLEREYNMGLSSGTSSPLYQGLASELPPTPPVCSRRTSLKPGKVHAASSLDTTMAQYNFGAHYALQRSKQCSCLRPEIRVQASG